METRDWRGDEVMTSTDATGDGKATGTGGLGELGGLAVAWRTPLSAVPSVAAASLDLCRLPPLLAGLLASSPGQALASAFPPAKESRSDVGRVLLLQELVDMCVGTSVGTITEPDCLGPCEPGTSVTLEGIVWHETEGGTVAERPGRGPPGPGVGGSSQPLLFLYFLSLSKLSLKLFRLN